MIDTKCHALFSFKNKKKEPNVSCCSGDYCFKHKLHRITFISCHNLLMIIFYSVFSMEGGELFSRIQERADSAFTERGKIDMPIVH